MNATSLLKRGENAMVIFTYGKSFKVHKDRSGSTGNWVISTQRRCRKVIIYKRSERGNDIYVARRAAIRRSKEEGRYIIQLADVRYFGTTYLNWPSFSGSRNPVRYFGQSSAKGHE
jgi:hypothetical protein